MTTDRPNLVLICVDQWRGDCLSIEGHPVLHTPHLDQLALRGARFSRAYSATPTCVPARMALMTGLSQTGHRRVGYQDGVPFDVETTLPGVLRANGYQTQAIGKMHYSPVRGRIGFDDVLLHDGYLHHNRRRSQAVESYDDYIPWLRAQAGQSAVADYVDNGVNCNSYVARPWDKDEALHPTSWLGTQAISWLYRRDPTVPFFLYLSFHRPHPPFDPPAWAFEQYLDAPQYDPPVGDWWEQYAEHRQDHRHDPFVAQFPPRILQRARAGYYGHMAHIDLQINRFLEALSEFELADNTYVCFVSDHGEMLGDHHLFRKGFPYEGSARIPFLLAGPRTGENVRRDEVVELRDVMPTLLDCAGVAIPPGVEGRSVLSLAAGEPAGDWRPYLHGEHALLGQSLQWLTDGRQKYVWQSGPGREQLFDLVADPHELRDLVDNPSYSDDLARWRQALVDELRDRPEGYVKDGLLVPGRPPLTLLPR
ncbi:arylsulfatase [Actinopolymorpha alba]|uniref:arylsulfatase n=1 Tax=Actinopolymorpha alba TaxID=533267 RepID=UPI0003816F6C|nr:arylsulfatase [Actinopolymorpha alba]